MGVSVAGTSESRIGAARVRASRAKTTLGLGATLVFGAALILARTSHAGHAPHHPRLLAAPSAFVSVVRQDQLDAGILAPSSSQADAVTSVS